MLTRRNRPTLRNSHLRGEQLERREALTANVMAVADIAMLEPHVEPNGVERSAQHEPNGVERSARTLFTAHTHLNTIANSSHLSTQRAAKVVMPPIVNDARAVDAALAEPCSVSPFQTVITAAPSSNLD